MLALGQIFHTLSYIQTQNQVLGCIQFFHNTLEYHSQLKDWTNESYSVPSSNSDVIESDLSDLAPGVYVYSLSTESGQYNHKVVKR